MEIKRYNSYAIFMGNEYPVVDHYSTLVGTVGDLKYGFKKSIYSENYIFPINTDQIESAYHVATWARYKGYDFFVRGYDKENDTYGLSIPWEMSKEIVLQLFGIIRRSGHDDDTPFFKDVEFEDIWELRTPIEGFRFVGPEKVYLKKDGVWLDEVI